MSPYDEFIHIPNNPRHPTSTTWPHASVPETFLTNTHSPRVFTEGLLASSIHASYPKHHLSITPTYQCDLLAYGGSLSRDDVSITPHGDAGARLVERTFLPPARRYNDEKGGAFGGAVVFAAFDYVWKGVGFLLFVAEGADGVINKSKYNYLLLSEEEGKKNVCVDGEGKGKIQGVGALADELIKRATVWGLELHDEVLVFDQGYWQKNTELWRNIQKSEWEDVILEKEKKEAIIEDIVGFFDGEKRYAEFNVPWKRGVIFYGPPGNGKTISTKALMHQVSKRTSPTIEALYVKTFNSFAGPEYGIRQIFLKARQMAPCLLIFEDIDSLVNVSVRSYFLNEVDGLESNHGILMIGSTNHLEQLDPGIAKRPSRFDRKYFFDVPSRDERVQYCEYWRNKLKDNKKIDFPKEMSARIADITDEFSFAYMKEAFVAALLVIVARTEKQRDLENLGDPLSDNLLWKEIKRQVENLRKEMDDESQGTGDYANIARMKYLSLRDIQKEEDRTRPARPLNDDLNNMVPRYM